MSGDHDQDEEIVSSDRDEKGRFVAGNSGNGGRPKGSRNKFATEFVDAMYADFMAHGAQTIKAAREKDPVGYVRICASILPKELKIERVDELSDEELDARIRTLASVIGIEIRAGEASDGEEAPLRH